MNPVDVVRALLQSGLKQNKIADELGVTQATVSRWLAGSDPRGETRDKIIDLGREHGIVNGDAPHSKPPNMVIEVNTRAGAGVGGIDDVVATVENGITISADTVRDYWSLPDSFLTGDLGMTHKSARIIEVQGDSMYDPNNPGAPGSIFPGERLIVDTSDKRPTPAGPFAIWDGIGITIKMVEYLQGSEPPKIRMTSRNSAYSPFEATQDEVQIIGRVKGKISVL